MWKTQPQEEVNKTQSFRITRDCMLYDIFRRPWEVVTIDPSEFNPECMVEIEVPTPAPQEIDPTTE